MVVEEFESKRKLNLNENIYIWLFRCFLFFMLDVNV